MIHSIPPSVRSTMDPTSDVVDIALKHVCQRFDFRREFILPPHGEPYIYATPEDFPAAQTRARLRFTSDIDIDALKCTFNASLRQYDQLFFVAGGFFVACNFEPQLLALLVGIDVNLPHVPTLQFDVPMIESQMNNEIAQWYTSDTDEDLLLQIGTRESTGEGYMVYLVKPSKLSFTQHTTVPTDTTCFVFVALSHFDCVIILRLMRMSLLNSLMLWSIQYASYTYAPPISQSREHLCVRPLHENQVYTSPQALYMAISKRSLETTPSAWISTRSDSMIHLVDFDLANVKTLLLEWDTIIPTNDTIYPVIQNRMLYAPKPMGQVIHKHSDYYSARTKDTLSLLTWTLKALALTIVEF